MSGWLNFFGKKEDKKSARDAILGLRVQLNMLTKKEEHLNKKIEEELRKAKANVTTNKRAAQAALRQKKVYENELDRLAGTRMTIESQVNSLESANMNLETMAAMRKGADALKMIHGSLNIDKVDSTMDSIREQMDLTNEISDAISNPVGMGHDLDEDELRNELEELEQDELNERLVGADSVPLHTPAVASSAGPSRVSNGTERQQAVVEDDDDAELRALQAELAM